MEIFTNFLSKDVERTIEDTLVDNNFPWYFNQHTSYNAIKTTKTLDTPFFSHMFFFQNKCNSDFYDNICIPIIEGLERKTDKNLLDKVWRIKANLYTNHSYYPDDFYHPIHIDNADKSFRGLTFIYYVNDTDGVTFMFNEYYDYNIFDINDAESFTKVSSERGKGVLFDISQFHASQPPSKGQTRMTINFVFGEYMT
jgi:hypothetical protein